jgi:hypothetical protein
VEDARLERWRRRRSDAAWTVAAGLGTLFVAGSLGNLGGLATALLVGAVLSTSYGVVAWTYYGHRIHKATDPWKYDPELDGPMADVLEGRALPRDDPDEPEPQRP